MTLLGKNGLTVFLEAENPEELSAGGY